MSQMLLLDLHTQRIDLIFHQRDERRDDNSRSFHHQGWQLVAKRLTTAGRHKHKGVIAVQNILNDLFLVALELIEAEILLQTVVDFFAIAHNYICLSLETRIVQHIYRSNVKQN